MPVARQYEPPLVVANVSKRYPRGGLSPFRRHPKQQAALRHVSFAVQPGETLGLLGPNGAGKTTLLKLIATLLYPSEGHIYLYGVDVVDDPLRCRRQLGWVASDERSFYWRLSGQHNLTFFATLYGVPNREIDRRVRYLLEVTGLEHAADVPFHSYSSGMKQKLAIARGLLGNPSVILYDEPTRSLDPLSAQEIREWLIRNRSYTPATAHVVATNQLQEAEQLCDRVLILSQGTVIAYGTIDEIRRQLHGETMIHRIRARNAPAIRQGLPAAPEVGLLDLTEERGVDGISTVVLRTTSDSLALSLVLETIIGGGGTVLRCETQQVPFDDLFCSLVSQHNTTRAKNARNSL
jgi:ABC-2 type transport system ATP-binding protein